MLYYPSGSLHKFVFQSDIVIFSVGETIKCITQTKCNVTHFQKYKYMEKHKLGQPRSQGLFPGFQAWKPGKRPCNFFIFEAKSLICSIVGAFLLHSRGVASFWCQVCFSPMLWPPKLLLKARLHRRFLRRFKRRLL